MSRRGGDALPKPHIEKRHYAQISLTGSLRIFYFPTKDSMPNNRRGFGRLAGDTLVGSTEKLSNPSFESSLTNWDTGAGGMTATVNTNSTYITNGSKSVHLTWTNIDDTLGQNITTFTNGATYLLTGDIRVISGWVAIGIWDGAIGTNGEMIATEAFCQSSQFESFAVVFQATNTTLVFQLAAIYDFSDVYIDNLSIKRMN